MKNLLNFCFGSSMSLIIANLLGFRHISAETIELSKAIISMFGGVISTVIVWYLSRKFPITNKAERKIRLDKYHNEKKQ